METENAIREQGSLPFCIILMRTRTKLSRKTKCQQAPGCPSQARGSDGTRTVGGGSERKISDFHAEGKQLKGAEGKRCEDDKTGCNQIEENIPKEIIVGLR